MSDQLKLGFVPASRAMFDQQLAVSVRDACIAAYRRDTGVADAHGELLVEHGSARGNEAEFQLIAHLSLQCRAGPCRLQIIIELKRCGQRACIAFAPVKGSSYTAPTIRIR